MEPTHRFVDRDDDREFRIVRWNDADEPGDVAILGVGLELEVEFLCRAGLAGHAHFGESGLSTRAVRADDRAHHVDGLAGGGGRNGVSGTPDRRRLPLPLASTSRLHEARPHPFAVIGQRRDGRSQLNARDREALSKRDRGLVDRLPK
jgi:hypothetical protein